jgi:hypothetical protein
LKPAVNYFLEVWNDTLLQTITNSTNEFAVLSESEKILKRLETKASTYSEIEQWIKGMRHSMSFMYKVLDFLKFINY